MVSKLMGVLNSADTEMASKLVGVLNSVKLVGVLNSAAANSIFLLRPDFQVAQHMVPSVDDEIVDRVPVVAVLVPAV